MTNATIRHAAGNPLPDQRGRVLKYWTEGPNREFIEVATNVHGAHLIFARIHPNKVWVHVVPSQKRRGKYNISRRSWMVPDAGAIEDAQHIYFTTLSQEPTP
jgi:hypothetical protein